ncbi:hypothetical protein LOC68_22725 [Blastopirellula sp. JC732]|uniref:Cytochrome C n=1 Tax=Blastopirellula sediminis TaxID=2894196 RepID=A0A9X1MRM8_9BACT|nr:hypothetical protein [Blastopirellula sediminis]MCC9605483.1 hypothetical protein [Blastopirellula sediminis]MCC9631217.1 hypothetical protein [Blastopirellula sediminis]
MQLAPLLLLPILLAADPTPPAGPAAKQVDPPGVHNLFQVTPRVFSGSQPHGAEGFESLEKIGIKVVVSVDGAKPDVAEAKKHGIKYVHIPFGYDGVPREAQLQLAEVMKQYPGQIYFHCHHGKHRGPAGVAIACLAEGSLTTAQAEAFMHQAGTSGDYTGLWKNVHEFQPISANIPRPMLVETAEVESLAAAMANIDRVYDNLVLIDKANWQTPADHPDLTPTGEALLMREGFYEMGRLLPADKYDLKFRQLLKASEVVATSIEAKLKSGATTGLSDDLAKLKKSCNACHVDYRN